MSNPNEPMSLNDFMPGPMVEEGVQARAGEPLAENTPVATMEDVEKALRTVYDPEIPIDIYELGLIYECDINESDGSTAIVMTLTAPACPVAGILPGQVAEAVAGVEGIGEVVVTLTWDPTWDKEMMSEDAKLALGLF